MVVVVLVVVVVVVVVLVVVAVVVVVLVVVAAVVGGLVLGASRGSTGEVLGAPLAVVDVTVLAGGAVSAQPDTRETKTPSTTAPTPPATPLIRCS